MAGESPETSWWVGDKGRWCAREKYTIKKQNLSGALIELKGVGREERKKKRERQRSREMQRKEKEREVGTQD